MRTILIYCLFLMPVALYGQDFRVSGKISDEELPLGFVSVRIPGTTYGTLSDEQGSFRLGPLPAGKYEIEFSLVGYQVRRVAIDLKENRRLDVRMW
jgi:outer membrane receptor for ferrienterochelin and colicins